MASVKLMETKDGKRFYKISVSRGYGKTPYTKRLYWEDGWSKRTMESKLRTEVANFERDCNEGKILSRAEAKEKAAQEAAEAAEAARKAAEERAKLKTFKSYAESVYMPTKAVSFSENARANYQMFLDKHIYPKLGDFLLTEITPAMLKAFFLEFQKQGYSHSTVIKCYNIVNGVLDSAYMDDNDGIIVSNPMHKVPRPKPRKDEEAKEDTIKALTAEQIQYVFDCIGKEVQEAKPGSDAYLSALKWQAYITLAFDSAARRGELVGLQWKDINWKSGTINIRRNVQYTPEKGVYDTSPKNGKGRKVDIGADTLVLLRQLREEQASKCISKWVFTQDGSEDVMFPTSPTRFFKKFGERIGIPELHPHLLRHSSASIAITNGADIASTSARLGHGKPDVTMRMYVHANDESIRKVGDTNRNAIKQARTKAEAQNE